jgi:hypothetical protein
MKRIFIFVTLLLLISCSNNSTDSSTITVEQFFDADSEYASSTKLKVHWEEQIADTYEIKITDTITNIEKEIIMSDGKTDLVVMNLKAGTAYIISVEACGNGNCELLGTTTKATEEEYWQIQGSGNSYEEATEVIEESSVLSYAIEYDDWAPEELQGETIISFLGQPTLGEASGIEFAKSTNEDNSAFERIDGYKLQHACDFSTAMEKNEDGLLPNPNQERECFGPWYMSTIQAFQIIPLESGIMRLMFESSDREHNTRIMYLESQDGYAGLDYNREEEETVCITEEDWNNGCKPTLAIGLEGDDEYGDTGLIQARQFKIGYSKMKSWLWDESEGTFMIITGADSCEQTRDGLFYAVWSGTQWNVEKDDDGCAQPLVEFAHGPVIVDLSPTSYKVYYEEQRDWIADHETPKPFQMIYADATSTGDPNIIDLEDWEQESVGRDVHFIWPNGDLVPDEVEPGLGDHYIYLPTNDLNYQVMYMNLGGFDDKTWNKGSSGIGMAVLVNP